MRPDADLSIPGLAQLVADLMAELDLHDVTLVGNDTGGAISQVVATRHPQRLGRLVLTPCDAFENFLPARFKYLQVLARVPGALWLAGQSQRPRRMRRLPIAYGALAKGPIPDEVLDAWVGPGLKDRMIRRDAGKVLRGISTRYTIEAAERLKAFDKPALLVWARGEKLFPEAHAHRLAKIIPNAKVTLIDGARTFMSEDKPEELADAIKGFLPG
jgi:pimeloyl-ACP methyl ester carboxylesterase